MVTKLERNAKLDDDDRFRQGQTRFSELLIHLRSCLHDGNSVHYSWQETEWRLRVTCDVLGDITERASDSRDGEKEVIIPLDASVRGYPSRNTTSWTVLELEVTALTLILRCSRTGTVWFYTSTSNKRAARTKLYTKSLTKDLKRMYEVC